VATDPEIVADTMAEFVKHKNDLVSSMHADLLAGNPLELDAINGAVSSRGRSLGVATPVNDFVTACLSLADLRARGRSV
jgi:2-dehydropantoate 2-reductase